MKRNRWLHAGLMYFTVMVALLALLGQYHSGGSSASETLAFNQIVDQALTGSVCKLAESGDGRTVTYYRNCTKGSQPAGQVRKSSAESLLQYVQRERAVRVQQARTLGEPPPALVLPTLAIEPLSVSSAILNALLFLLPVAVLIGGFIFIARRLPGSNNEALLFGKSRARKWFYDRPRVSFAQVAGQEEGKQELAEVVEFLKWPAKFKQLGARIPRGVLMVGPPGTGKTLLSRAIAGEAGVPFFSISGSEFVEMYVGVGASRVRDLFQQAKRSAPCIIFIDEIDAVGRQRGVVIGAAHEEREQTLNQILVEMDGFDTTTSVIVIAATNRPDVLDPALVRPGRFDRQVMLDAPDMQGRLAILKVHARGKPVSEVIDWETIAKMTVGASGADLANILNEGAILAARRDQKLIRMVDLEDATERLLLGGPERRSRVLTQEQKRLAAYHEAGHAIVGTAMPKADPVHKITIVPRGRSGGYTLFLPAENQDYRTVQQFEAQMAYAMGGRAAEELVLRDFTTGAANDIKQVSRLARSMVTRLGMSDRLGPVHLGETQELTFRGRQISDQRNYSEETARVIDAEIKQLVATAHRRAVAILGLNMHVLHELAELLLVVETIGGDELVQILGKVRSFPEQRHTGIGPLFAAPSLASVSARETGEVVAAAATQASGTASTGSDRAMARPQHAGPG